MLGELNVVQLFLSAGIQEFSWWLAMSLWACPVGYDKPRE